jgi:protoporphyrinogen oxidase
MVNMHTGVLGAGALGLTLAYRLAQTGDRVTVIEREPEPGGLAAGFRVATDPSGSPVYLEKFYHHLFRADHAATDLIAELGLDDRLVWPQPVSAILRDGEVQALGPIDLLRLKALPFPDRLRMGAVLAYLKLEKGYQRLEGQTAEAWLRRWMGDRAYAVFADPLLRQKFGDYASEIAMPWFWSRVHLRSTALGYMTGGFQHLYNRLAERIAAAQGTLRFDVTVTGIAPNADGSLQVAMDQGTQTFDRVVSTLPAALTFRLTPALPEDFRQRYRPGAAYGAHCLVLELDRSLTDVYWIAINDPGYPFLAVVEHTNYIPPEQYEGKRLVYVGNYVPMDHPLMRQPAEETLADFAPYLRRINPAFDTQWVQRAHAFAAPFAQPIVTTDFREHIAPHDTPVPNLYMANMFQIYPQDRGQNYSIAMAERVARRLQRAGMGAPRAAVVP